MMQLYGTDGAITPFVYLLCLKQDIYTAVQLLCLNSVLGIQEDICGTLCKKMHTDQVRAGPAGYTLSWNRVLLCTITYGALSV